MSNLRATEISPMDLRASLGEFLDRVRLRHDSFIIARRGEQMAALVPVEQLQLMQDVAAKYAKLMLRSQEDFLESTGAKLEDVEQEAIEAVKWYRARKRGK